MFAVRKMPKAKKKMIRAQSGLAILLALAIVINLICTCLLYTSLENVEVPLVYAGIPAAQRHATAKAALERVGLGNKLKNLPNQLSGILLVLVRHMSG